MPDARPRSTEEPVRPVAGTSLRGRRPADRRVRVDRYHTRFFRYGPGGHLEARESASAPREGWARLSAPLRRLLFGRPLASAEEMGERASKTRALAIFSSDAISSSTYASEEILLVLMLAGAAGAVWSVPLAIGIAALLLIVSTSYRQICHAYPSGGGAYAVARANIGALPALVAAAALLFDYLMTVAVSTAAGVAAVTSVFPGLIPWRVELCLVALGILTVANLRGLRESGNLFAIPTYAFVGGALALIGVGLLAIVRGDPAAAFAPPPVAPGLDLAALGPVLLVRAFAFGSVALTGTEAISNGVPAFQPPEARNAAATLTAMAVLLGVIFVGISLLAAAYGVGPNEHETLISQVARAGFGEGPVYLAFQAATALILVLAANTGFNGAPRLAQILAIDGYLPRQFGFRGDRLAYTFGIVILAAASAAFLVWSGGSVSALIPMYSVGIFASFTLSQAGMVRHWLRERVGAWRAKLALNALGALVTGVVALIITAAKFERGAWIVLLAVPTITALMLFIHREYARAAEELAVEPERVFGPPRRHARVVIPVAGINRAVVAAVTFGRTLSDDLRAVFVTEDHAAGEALLARWEHQFPGVPLVVIDSPFRAVVEPVLAYLDFLDERDRGEQPTTIVILPEYVARRWWDRILYNQAAKRLRGSLVGRAHTVVADVPYRRRH